MKRSVVLVLLALALLIGVLGALDVIPLGFGSGAEPADSDGTDLLAADEEATGNATLAGRGRPKDEAAAASTLTVDPTDGIPASVKGGTPGGGVVRGRVIREKTGLPMAGARVTLSRPDSLLSYLRAQVNGRYDSLEARTGTDGRFTFSDITPSQGYALRAFHADFAAVSHPERLDLRGRGSFDVGDLKLGAGSTLTGRVVDEQGQPLADVRVAVSWHVTNALGIVMVHADTAPELERETVTDTAGRYILDKLEPRAKTVFAEVPGGGAEAKLRISLKPGQTRELKDMVIPSQRALAGTVVWKGGGPVVGARVFCAPNTSQGIRAVDADAEGHWRVEYLPEAAAYAIGVLVEGLPVHLEEKVAAGREDVVIEFEQPGRVEGTVVRAGSAEPVLGFSIQLTRAQPYPDRGQQLIAQLIERSLGPVPFRNESGSFVLPQVATGEYTLNVHAAGFPSVRREGIVIAGGETTSVRIELLSGNVARGRVERASGGAVAGARLYVVPAGSVKAGSQPVSLRRLTDDREPAGASRSDGTFELPPQTPGRYDLIAELEDELPGVLRNVDLSAGDATGLGIRLPPSGGVTGRLLDEDGRPAGGQEVYVLYRNGIVRTFHTDAKGQFEASGLPVGRCLVRWVSLGDTRAFFEFSRSKEEGAKARGYDELRQQGEEHVLTDGQVVRVSLRLPPRTKVSGRFRIAAGVPPEPKRTFYVTVKGGGRWITVDADEHGEFEFRIPPGTYLTYAPTSQHDYAMGDLVVPESPTYVWDLDTE